MSLRLFWDQPAVLVFTPLTSLEYAVTQRTPISPLECAVTKKGGGGTPAVDLTPRAAFVPARYASRDRLARHSRGCPPRRGSRRRQRRSADLWDARQKSATQLTG